jgi:hypothetical protein
MAPLLANAVLSTRSAGEARLGCHDPERSDRSLVNADQRAALLAVKRAFAGYVVAAALTRTVAGSTMP